MKYHEGVFIDIFVLDNVPDNAVLRKMHRFACFCIRKILWSRSGRRIASNAVWRAWYMLISLIPASFAFWCNNTMAKICNRRRTRLVRHNTHPYPNPKVCGYGVPAGLLEEFIKIGFEGREFHAVAEYDRYLTMLYSDYMQLPPEEKRKPLIHLSAFEGVKAR